ncbi:hypothetical protein V6N13_063930 [Hibiscus sabdariffa]|uniref:Uncharacterized protein n=1 Tax=Hibiscus sabdariffa TaxID=183260 RepID=A0ABR2R1K7_9ROSI
MDNADNNEEKTASVLQVNEMFLRKILSRNDSSLDNSVCIPHRRSIGVVPFQWELEPGTPKHRLVPEKEIVSPIKPLSRTMSSRMIHEINKQCINEARESRSWFRRKSRKVSQGDIKGKDKAKSKGNFGFDYSRSFSTTSSRVTSLRLRSFAKKWAKWLF